MLENMRNNMSWRAVLIAGFGGGTVFLLVLLLLTPLVFGINAMLPIQYFASLVMGDSVLLESSATTLIIGVLVHYGLSLVFALLIAFVVHRWGLWVGILGGAGMGLAIYGINLYTMTVFFPWFFAINSVVLLGAHIAFGAITGGIYEMLDNYDMPIKTKTEVA